MEKERKVKPIETTFELVEIIKKSLPAKVLRQKGHPAKQVFQALRLRAEQSRLTMSLLQQTLTVTLLTIILQRMTIMFSNRG